MDELFPFLRREAPRLFEVAMGGLDGFTPAPKDHVALTRFAHDVRVFLGWERLPDPVHGWATLGPGEEPGLRRTLAEGKLEMRAWEGRLTLWRRPRGGVRSALSRLILDHGLDEPIRSLTLNPEGDEPTEVAEWRTRFRGTFDRLLVVLTGKELLFLLEPALVPTPLERSHEGLTIEAPTRKPPAPHALPCPIAVPSGGRFPSPKKKIRR